jgi:membrane-bound serine protease (ClpP class)
MTLIRASVLDKESPMRRLSSPPVLIASLLFGPLVSLVSLWLAPASGAGSPVVVATYEGVINPVTAEYLHDALAFAESNRAQLLVVKLDTPGGLVTSMQTMVKSIVNAPLPVAVYVSPSGGRAASAGVFITLAGHVAAMAPGTNIGAAHPVAMGGEMDKTMKEKAENDMAASIKTLAGQRGRNVKWAEDAVRKSVSVTEKEALDLKIIDLVVEDVPALLAKLDGRTITLANGSVTLQTKGADTLAFPMGWRLEALKALSDPNIAMLLMTIGTIGILAELYNPGAILPGIVGAISLILAFYSLQSLPINYAGLLLIVLGIVLFILEIKVTSYGLLTLGGIAAMTLGGLLLVKSDAPFMQVSLSFLLPTVLTAAAIMFTMAWLAMKARQRAPVTGRESMIGEIARARTDVAPRGEVFLHGELWEAMSETPIRKGDEAEVQSVEGLTLKVVPRHK